jgi:hypothetical protein
MGDHRRVSISSLSGSMPHPLYRYLTPFDDSRLLGPEGTPRG